MLWGLAQLVADPSEIPAALAKRFALVVALMAFAWSLLLAAVGFGLATLYLWLAVRLETPAAAGVTAAAAALAAAVGFRLALRWSAPRGDKSPATEVIRRHPMESLLLALSAGIVVSQSAPARAALASQVVAALAKKGAP